MPSPRRTWIGFKVGSGYERGKNEADDGSGGMLARRIVAPPFISIGSWHAYGNTIQQPCQSVQMRGPRIHCVTCRA